MPDQPEPRTLWQEGALPCALLSGVCLIVGVLHFVSCDFTADFPLVALIVVGFAPWLGHVFKGIGRDGVSYWPLQGLVVGEPKSSSANESGGDGSGGEGVPDQSPATPPTAPTPTATPPIEQPLARPPTPYLRTALGSSIPFSDLTPPEKKVLATLWKYQRIHFTNPDLGQWTFTINPQVAEYATFAYGVLGLRILSLAGIAGNGHVVLTREGVHYCERHPEVALWTDTYDHFSN